jgi:hypothetical protein
LVLALALVQAAVYMDHGGTLVPFKRAYGRDGGCDAMGWTGMTGWTGLRFQVLLLGWD